MTTTQGVGGGAHDGFPIRMRQSTAKSLAVDDSTPAVLEVPEIINRYYTVQVMDEWGDVIAASLGDHLVVRLEPVEGDDEARLIEITPSGASWATRWARLSNGLEEWRC